MSRSRYPTRYVDEAALSREMPVVLKVLQARGVPERDLKDVAQEVLLAAWLRVQQGRLRAPPEDDLRKVLQRWMTGIAWRQASHYRDKAYNRYEDPSGQPGEYLSGEAPPPEAQVAAREVLRIALPELPPECLEVVELAATGATDPEIAEKLGIPEGTAGSRRRRARERFAQSLQRWRR